MFAALFRFIFRLFIFAIIIVVFTVVWVVYDGLNDSGQKADVAVVLGNAVKSDGDPGPVLRARLDKAVELYRAGTFPLIIVSGAKEPGGRDEATGMAKYLVSQAVPADAIIQDPHGVTTSATAVDVAAIMHQRNLTSVMVITHYYHITRTKLALRHENITNIQQAHCGIVQKEDAFHVAREIVAIYYYVGKYYLIPASEKAKIEAQKAAAEAKVEAQKAGDAAKQEIDSMKKQ